MASAFGRLTRAVKVVGGTFDAAESLTDTTTSMLSTYGEPIPFDRFIHPRVESEIAFLLARDIEAPATVTSVLAATDVVFGAVDVLDSR